MKFRKRPVEVEAIQHFADMGTYTVELPQWLIQACLDGTVFAENGETFINTLEGKMHVSDGDWIIRGVHGEMYPCKPDIFEKTYERI